MKNLLTTLFLLSATAALAQNAQPPVNKYYGITPSKGGSGSPPTGAAGGDLSGTYPNPGVAKIDGTSVPATPSANQALIATGSTAATWETVPVAAGGTGATAAGATAANNIGALAEASNLSDLASTSAALTNLGIPTKYCALAGCTMTGAIGMSSNNVNNIATFNSSFGFVNNSNSQTTFTQYATSNPIFSIGNVGDASEGMWTFQSGSGFASRLQFGKSHSSTYGTQSLVTSTEALGSVYFSGSDGYQFVQAAGLSANIDAAPTAGSGVGSPGIMPGNLRFSTTNTSGTSVQALYIDSAQNIKVGPSSSEIADRFGNIYGQYGYFNGTSAPIFSNGVLGLYGSASLGGIVSGQGSNCDVSIQDNAGGNALCVPTGTTNLNLTEAGGFVKIYGFPYVDFGSGNGYGFNLFYSGGWKYAGSSDYGYALTNNGACLIIQAAPSGTAGGSASPYTSHQFCEDGHLTVAAYIQPAAYTVSGLPTCNSGTAGAIAYVTDASSPSYNATLSGGSSTKTLAMCNGTNWTAH